MTDEDQQDYWASRLDAVEKRLRRHAEGSNPEGLTDPDAETGERWGAGQVWAHMAEFIPYWIEQLQSVFELYDGVAVPFGRTKTDLSRIEAIERNRSVPKSELFEQVAIAIVAFRGWMLTWGEREFTAHGRHSRLGDMDTRTIVERFLVGHLEEHADQLDGLGD